MPDTFFAIVVLLLLLPVVALVAGVVWAVRKQRRAFAFTCVLLLCGYVGIGISQRLVPGFNWLYERWFIRELTGVAVSLGPPLHAYETDRSWHGDGLSVLTYGLPNRLAARFHGSPSDLASYPRRSKDRDDWDVHYWMPSPVAAEHKRFVDFAISGAPEELQAKVWGTLNRSNGWYAIRYKEARRANGELLVHNVDLFIVDLQEGTIYVVNQNT